MKKEQENKKKSHSSHQGYLYTSFELRNYKTSCVEPVGPVNHSLETWMDLL